MVTSELKFYEEKLIDIEKKISSIIFSSSVEEIGTGLHHQSSRQPITVSWPPQVAFASLFGQVQLSSSFKDQVGSSTLLFHQSTVTPDVLSVVFHATPHRVVSLGSRRRPSCPLESTKSYHFHIWQPE